MYDSPPSFDWTDRDELVHPLHDAGHACDEPGRAAIRPLFYVRPVTSEVSLDRGYLLRVRVGAAEGGGGG